MSRYPYDADPPAGTAVRLLTDVAIVVLTIAVALVAFPGTGRAAELSEADLKQIRHIVAAIKSGDLPAPPG